MNLPVLIVWGEDDRWLSPDIGVQLEADFPNAQRVTFPDVGHLPMLEAAEDFAQALDTFWQGQGSSRQ
jgi:pimeloyl-ACP methyl ester carboxylesterase